MKICITSKGENLDSDVDPRFGRCQFFIIVDTKTMLYNVISNDSTISSGGAGIQAAQQVAKTSAKIVITGNIGPNAFNTLSAAGITVITDVSGTIENAVEKYKNGEFNKVNSASVDSHFGMKALGKDFGKGDN